jgi:hypothetical protein
MLTLPLGPITDAFCTELSTIGGARLVTALRDVAERGIEIEVALLHDPVGVTLYVHTECDVKHGLMTREEQAAVLANVHTIKAWHRRLVLTEHCGCGQHHRYQLTLISEDQ